MTPLKPRAARLLALALFPVLTASSLRGQDLAKMLPPDTLAHLEINGEPCHRVGGRLALARIMAEPEVQAFLKSLHAPMSQLHEQAGAMLSEFGFELDDILQLLRGRVTVSFLGMGQGGPDLALTCDFKHAKDAGRRVVDGLVRALTQSAGAEVSEIDIAGRKGVQLAMRDGPPIALVDVDGLLVAGTNPASLGQMLRRMDGAEEPNLAGTPGWKGVAAHLRTKNDVVYLWGNVRGLLGTFGPSFPEEVGAILEAVGVDSLNALGYAFTLDGPAFRDRFFAYIPEPKGLFNKLAPKGDTTLVADKMVPEDTVLFGTTSLDLGALLDWGLDVAEKIQPGMGEEVREQMAGLSQQIGFDLETGLIDLIGPEVAFYASLPGQALIPDVGILAHVSDATKVEANLTRLVQGLGNVPVKTFAYHGEKISYADLGALGLDWDRLPPLKPSWTVVDGHLLVTLWPQSAKNLIRGLKTQQPRLADKPDYKRLLALVRERDPAAGNAGREYFDVKRLAGFILDNGVPFAQSLIPAIPDVPDIEWAAFPSTGVITQHLFGMVGTTTWKKDGVATDYVSPTGVLPVYVAMFATLGFVMVGEAEVAFAEIEMAQRERAMVDLDALKQCVRLFHLKEGRLPAESEWPHFLFKGSKKHPEAYINPAKFPSKEVLDPWGNPYVYTRISGRDWEIISYGADGTPGGVGEAADLSTKKKK